VKLVSFEDPYPTELELLLEREDLLSKVIHWNIDSGSPIDEDNFED
jgi:hypothetical protein